MNRSLLLLALVCACACAHRPQGPDGGSKRFARATADQSASAVPTINRGKLIFEDTFETLDYDKWQHEITASGGGNWEFQYYTNNRSNSYVRDNVLYLKPTLTEDNLGEGSVETGTLSLWGGSPADLCTGNNFWGCERVAGGDNYINPIQSARLRSVNSFAFQYGTLEVIAQLPKGDWIWPAIWLLSKNNPYGGWPASGEIDLMESRGNRNLVNEDGVNVGVEQVGMTLHWGPWFPLNRWDLTHNSKNAPSGTTYGDDFSNYTLQWHSEGMKLYLDGELILTVDPADGFWDKGGFEADNPGIENPWTNSPNKMAPFDSEYYILLNVAIGGTQGYFSDGLTNSPKPKPWLNTSPNAFKDFWLAKDDWYPTWNPETNNGEDAAMKIKSVRVWALPSDDDTSYALNRSPSLLYTLTSVILVVAAGRAL